MVVRCSRKRLNDSVEDMVQPPPKFPKAMNLMNPCCLVEPTIQRRMYSNLLSFTPEDKKTARHGSDMIRQHFTIPQKPFKTPPMFWLSWMPLWLVQTSNSLNIKDDELSFKGSSAKMAMRHSQHWGPTFRKAPQHGLLGLFLIKSGWWCLVCKKLCFNRQSNLTIRLTHLASDKIIKIPAYPQLRCSYSRLFKCHHHDLGIPWLDNFSVRLSWHHH